MSNDRDRLGVHVFRKRVWDCRVSEIGLLELLSAESTFSAPQSYSGETFGLRVAV